MLSWIWPGKSELVLLYELSMHSNLHSSMENFAVNKENKRLLKRTSMAATIAFVPMLPEKKWNRCSEYYRALQVPQGVVRRHSRNSNSP